MSIRKLFYMGLEPYEGRYTLQLTDWSRTAFQRNGIDWVNVPGQTIDNSKMIQVGQVLDAHGRSYYSLSQMMNLIQMMRNGDINANDVIFFEDMFSPGIESLPYIMDQIPSGQRPKVWVRCLAQSIDPDDFVHVCKMNKWMSLYEGMVNEFVTGILASNEEMVANMKVANWRAPIYNVSGLAFDKNEVTGRVKRVEPFNSRNYRIVFAARFDQEKQPDFFMDLIDAWYKKKDNREVEFAILQGGPLRSNDKKYIERANKLESAGKLSIYSNLSKNEYYQMLNHSRVLFNCALQDWTSNTVSEADALGCNVLYPAYRSFPEIFANDHTRLYIPWSIEDAIIKLKKLLEIQHHNIGKISNWTHQTIDRYISIMQGEGEEWLRNDIHYRNHVSNTYY